MLGHFVKLPFHLFAILSILQSMPGKNLFVLENKALEIAARASTANS
jgi:hypothetical protein